MWMQDTCWWGMCVVVVYDVGCMWDFCTGCAFYVDVCGTTALVLHAMWIYVGLLHCYMDVCGWIYVLLMHWLYMLCGLCWTAALVVHAVWIYVGPLHMLYMPGGCIWVHCTGCM